jgi:ABC-type transporter MlaC component
MKELTDEQAIYFAETLRNLLEQGYLDDIVKQLKGNQNETIKIKTNKG